MAERLTDSWNVSAEYRKDDFLADGLNLDLSLSHTWDYSLTVDTAFRKYDWNGGYIVSSRNEITGNKRSMRHYKRPMTLVHANADYALNAHHGFNLDYSMNRTGNDRYDDLDTGFEPSNDILTKHITGLSYYQSFFDDRWNNTFFVKDYVNHANIRQTDSGATTGSNNVRGSITRNYWGYGVYACPSPANCWATERRSMPTWHWSPKAATTSTWASSAPGVRLPGTRYTTKPTVSCAMWTTSSRCR